MKEQNNKPWWQPAIQLFAQISAWIVFPILAGLFIGQWLDDKYNKEPMFLLICIGVAFVITNVGLVVNTVKASKKMQEESLKEKSEKEKNKIKETKDNI